MSVVLQSEKRIRMSFYGGKPGHNGDVPRSGDSTESAARGTPSRAAGTSSSADTPVAVGGSPSTPHSRGSSEDSDGDSESLFVFKYVRVGEVQLQGSFKGTHFFNDVPGVTVKIHTLTYNSQRCTLPALLNRIKKDVILDILSQVSTRFGHGLCCACAAAGGPPPPVPSVGCGFGTLRCVHVQCRLAAI